MTNNQIEKLCIWSGVFSITLFFCGFLIAGFVPPPRASLSQSEVVAIYQMNSAHIRIGMIIVMVSGMLMAPFVGVISVQLKRIQGVSPVLIYAQISTGTANAMFFFIPAVLFLVTAYRPNRPPEITYMMNDLCWISAIIPWPPAFMQSAIIGLAVLNDKNPCPQFPRWLGYLNFWIAICYLPGTILAFVKVGPFAWNGLFAFWLAGAVFSAWFVAMAVALLKSTKAREQDVSFPAALPTS